MKKLYVIKEDLNSEELRTGRVSYARLVKRVIGNDLVLCNNIENLDSTIWNNMESGFDEEIMQFYLCNIDNMSREINEELGKPLILSYSDMLDLDILMVDHWGTSWDYVMTEIEWTENFDEC